MTNSTTTQETCFLCDLPLPSNYITDSGRSYCCHGCHAVYGILSAKGETSQFKEHPIFASAVKGGIISNPQLLNEIHSKSADVKSDELKKYYLEIGDMWCPSCAEVVKLILLRKKGITHCIVDYTTDLASIEYNPRYISKEQINETIESLGYTPLNLQSDSRPISFSLLLRFIIAAFCSLNIMMFSYPIYASYFSIDSDGYSRLFANLSLVASLPSVTFCMWPILKKCLNGLRVGVMGMEMLVVIGVSSAFSLSVYNLYQGGTHVYFDSMSAIITLLLLGKIIESKAKFSSKDSIIRIVRSTPKRGRKVLADGKQKFVPIKDISVGDELMVVTGEKIVLDGVVVSGEGVCDESLMTGESLPRKKAKGDGLLGGTFIQNGSLTYRVSNTLEETALHKIIDVVEADVTNKTKYIRAADSVIKLFVPVVVSVASLTAVLSYISNGVFEESIVRAVSVLLISCPCAIGIAAPLAEAYMIRAMANIGALVRNRGSLNLIGKETVFACDKTGTITEGCFHIIDGLQSVPNRDLAILKSLVSHSNHPIAYSTSSEIREKPIPLDDIEEIIGKGMKGSVHGETYLFGSKQLLLQEGAAVSEDFVKSLEGCTVAYFSKKGSDIYPITLGDKIKGEAPGVLASLSTLKRVLLSGDNVSAVKSVAAYCGFDEFYAECHPLDKRNYIDGLRKSGEIVSMLGDGINDAPALTTADIGMSVVSASDISIHVSDIVLTSDTLTIVPKIRELALKGQKIIKQNLFWAFFYNIIGVTMATQGVLSPLFAAAAMVLSSLIVIINAKRIS
ncbi:MAG: heavy metal translocating P-type ATPase [Chlamydiota bacterium]|nr:heavy metal translocating P-type ATPase [Chlamydiota bacterium]